MSIIVKVKDSTDIRREVEIIIRDSIVPRIPLRTLDVMASDRESFELLSDFITEYGLNDTVQIPQRFSGLISTGGLSKSDQITAAIRIENDVGDKRH